MKRTANPTQAVKKNAHSIGINAPIIIRERLLSLKHETHRIGDLFTQLEEIMTGQIARTRQVDDVFTGEMARQLKSCLPPPGC